MTAPVRFLDEAVVELEDASSWYQEQRLGLGLVFLTAVDRTVDRMSRWPERFPYYLAYLSREEGLLVLAVAHERRRPRYWSGRAN